MRAKWPRWLVPNWSSKPSAVVRLGVYMTPALLRSRSILSWVARRSSAARRTESSDDRSRCWTVTSAPALCPAIVAAASLPLSTLRTASTTDAPRAASALAVSSPRPVLAPVTTATRPVWSGMSSVVQVSSAISPSRGIIRGVRSDWNYTGRTPRLPDRDGMTP